MCLRTFRGGIEQRSDVFQQKNTRVGAQTKSCRILVAGDSAELLCLRAESNQRSMSQSDGEPRPAVLCFLRKHGAKNLVTAGSIPIYP